MPSLDNGAWLEAEIAAFCAGPANTLGNAAGDRAFDAPLVGFSSGADPLYEAYKEHVGPDHWTPAEAFRLAFPGQPAAPRELTVISWILPHTEATRRSSRRRRAYPSEAWARARVFGEEFNAHLRRHVVEVLAAAGVPAVAPQLLPAWERKTSTRFTIVSTWSERHAAHAGGLGTFGLCDGLITPRGKAMRTASVVARMRIAATPRPYTGHRDYCLFFSHGLCGRCIPRCPAKALSLDGHDKRKCRAWIRGTCAAHVARRYHFKGYACGLCQTGVPCESRIPTPGDL
jgi:epoxyqueuosine reductase